MGKIAISSYLISWVRKARLVLVLRLIVRGMGGICSKGCGEGSGKRGKMKIKTKKKQQEPAVPDIVDPDEDLFPDTFVDEEEEQEREEINAMRMLLHDDLPKFVINNVLMSVQFFKNFDG